MAMLPTDHFDERVLTLLFDVDDPEQAEALGGFEVAFGAATDIEAVGKSIYALHIQPGYPGYPRDILGQAGKKKPIHDG